MIIVEVYKNLTVTLNFLIPLYFEELEVSTKIKQARQCRNVHCYVILCSTKCNKLPIYSHNIDTMHNTVVIK